MTCRLDKIHKFYCKGVVCTLSRVGTANATITIRECRKSKNGFYLPLISDSVSEHCNEYFVKILNLTKTISKVVLNISCKINPVNSINYLHKLKLWYYFQETQRVFSRETSVYIQEFLSKIIIFGKLYRSCQNFSGFVSI